MTAVIVRSNAMPVYLDNHATMPRDPRVVDAGLPWLTEKPAAAVLRLRARETVTSRTAGIT